MAVTSLVFGVYLLATIIIYWLLPHGWRKPFLIATSVVIIGYTSMELLALIIGLSTLTYWLGKITYGGKKGRGLLTLGILIPVSILGYYKYTPMLVDTLNIIGKKAAILGPIRVTEILVPIGISFFTFKLIHYLIECYKGEAPQGSYLDFLAYMTFYPIFTSGPIERWPHFHSQSPSFNDAHISIGMRRIIIGLIKKKVIADNLVIFASMLNVPGISSLGYWMAAYAYALQIYFDFSGYSDIAIGSARLFGYEIMENFNWPYLQRNISLFWKNWHMTLTSWFTQYIFIPLGGSRVSFPRIVFNTLAVMAVTGIWHGAAWHFMLWGLYHGIGLIIWRIYGIYMGTRVKEKWGNSPVLGWASTILTFHFVVLGWVFFAIDFQQSLHVAARMLFLK